MKASSTGWAYTTFNTSSLGVGTHTINAVYRGDTRFQGSTASLSELIKSFGVQTTSHVYSSQSTTIQNGWVTFTDYVYSSGSSPTGIVSFLDGGKLIGTSYLTPAGYGCSYATFGTSGLTVGTHTIQAVFNGDYSFQGSSASLTEIVNAAFVKPATAVLIGPSGTTNNTPVISWYLASNASQYRVYIWDYTTGRVVIDQWTQSTWLSSPWLSSGRWYGVAVQTYGNGLWGDWSLPSTSALRDEKPKITDFANKLPTRISLPRLGGQGNGQLAERAGV